jgi:cell division protein FtsB
VEFSFERSQRSQNSNQTQASSNNSNPQSNPEDDNLNMIANERLKKAIERNRARQRERENVQSTNLASQTQQKMRSTQEHQTNVKAEPIREEVQQGLFKEQNKEQEESIEKIEKVEDVQRPSRRTVARPEDDIDFVPVKRTPRRVTTHVSYSTSATKKKAKSIDPKLTDYFVKGLWGFCAVLILRLIFAQGGVTDFLSQRSTLIDRFTELSKIKNENMSLVKEIERMQLDAGYQKRLVRDNLGFIAEDEFLILFPEGK